MRIMRILFFALCMLLLAIPLFCGGEKDAEQALNKARVSHPTTILPGEPLFVEVFFSKKQETLQEFLLSFYAQPTQNEEKKVLIETDFYPIQKNNKDFRAIIPLSTFLQPGQYTICLTRKYEQTTLIDEINITVLEREFIEEVIPLNSKNTTIRTDTSTKRTKQIEKLFALFDTIDYTGPTNFQHFIKPIETERLTGFFGDRRIYRYSNGTDSTSIHHGIDFGVPIGTPIVACADGRVVMAEQRISTGFSVVIEHLPGLYSIYYHLDSFSVEENQIIKQGERIGLSGATGMVTGPHLHWEVRLLGKSVDPNYFFEHQKLR